MKVDYLATPDQLREEAMRMENSELVAQQIFCMGIITGLEDLKANQGVAWYGDAWRFAARHGNASPGTVGRGTAWQFYSLGNKQKE